MLRTALFSGILCVSIFACRNQSPNASNTPAQAEQTTQSEAGQLPDDFNEFYQKFHADSLYQIEHISWPLEGLTSIDLDSGRQEIRNIHWERANWRMHQPVDFASGEFKRRIQLLSDELLIERISYAKANFGLERRFVRRSPGNWELIYYADMLETGK